MLRTAMVNCFLSTHQVILLFLICRLQHNEDSADLVVGLQEEKSYYNCTGTKLPMAAFSGSTITAHGSLDPVCKQVFNI
jgi:hypothetical protein